MCCGMMAWRDSAAGRQGGLARGWARKAWTPWEIALMVTGFVVFWPVGLAILSWMLWTRWRCTPAWFDRVAGATTGAGAPGATGMRGASSNSAFEQWKRGELDRLDQERRRLAEAEHDFAAFLDQLKRARDREEFDRFMAARTAPPPAQ